MTRVLAWILRFINNCKQHDQMNQVELSIEEVLDAENYIIKEYKRKNLMRNTPHLLRRKNYLNTVSYLAFVQNSIVKE